MVYALPRKSRTSGAGDASPAHVVSPPKSSVERALELQHVLDASHRAPRAAEPAADADASAPQPTPRRRRPHAFADDTAAPTSSTPLTPRRALRPYPDLPAPNWSASRSSPHSTPAHRRAARPLAVLDEEEAPPAPAAAPPPARVQARGSFVPQRRPPPAAESSHLVQHPPSPASSTDDPLLLNDSGLLNMTLQAAQGDADLVAMVRGWEHAVPSPGTPRRALRPPHARPPAPAERSRAHATPTAPEHARAHATPTAAERSRAHATPTASTPLRRDLRTIERSVQRAAQAQAQLQRERAASPSTPTRTPRGAQADGTPRATPPADVSHATPSLYDRSLGVRERIALLKSPHKARGASTPRAAPDTVPRGAPADGAPDPDPDPAAAPADDLPDLPDEPPAPLAPIPSHTPSRERRGASGTPRRASRRRPSSTSTPVYIDFLHAPPDEAPDDDLPFTRETPAAQRTRVVSPVKIRSASRTASPVRRSPVPLASPERRSPMPLASTPRGAAPRASEPADAFAFERVGGAPWTAAHEGALGAADEPDEAQELADEPDAPDEPYENREPADELDEPYEQEVPDEPYEQEVPDEPYEPYEQEVLDEPYEAQEAPEDYEAQEVPDEPYEAQEVPDEPYEAQEAPEDYEAQEVPDEPYEAQAAQEDYEAQEVPDEPYEAQEAQEDYEAQEVPDEPYEAEPEPLEDYETEPEAPEDYETEPEAPDDEAEPEAPDDEAEPEAPDDYEAEPEAPEDDAEPLEPPAPENDAEPLDPAAPEDNAEPLDPAAPEDDAEEPYEGANKLPGYAHDLPPHELGRPQDGYETESDDAHESEAFAHRTYIDELEAADAAGTRRASPADDAAVALEDEARRAPSPPSPTPASPRVWSAEADAETATLTAELMAHRTTDAASAWGDVTSLDTIDVDAEARAFAARHALWSPRSPRRARRSLLGRADGAAREAASTSAVPPVRGVPATSPARRASPYAAGATPHRARKPPIALPAVVPWSAAPARKAPGAAGRAAEGPPERAAEAPAEQAAEAPPPAAPAPVATPPDEAPLRVPEDFRPHKPSPQKHATLRARPSPLRRPASRVPVPVRRARAAYVEDADETHDAPAAGRSVGGAASPALVVGDAPADASTVILDAAHDAPADAARGPLGGAPAAVAGHKHARAPSRTPSPTPAPKRVRGDAPATPAAAAASDVTSESEATPPPMLSSPAAHWPLVAPADAVADLSANLSASSHSRALMLARPRPTACIEVASLDPLAAARAAAILQVHHQYIQEGWLVQEPPGGGRVGGAYPALPEASGSALLPALLQAAEAGERSGVAAVAGGVPSTPWVPGAFPPGSARRRPRVRAPEVTAHALRPQAQAGRWSDEAWAQLERHLEADVARRVEADAPDAAALRQAVLAADAGAVVRALLDAAGLEADELQGEWALTRLHARVPALQARYLRRLDAGAAPEAAPALRAQSVHALGDAAATATDALVHGPRARARSGSGSSPDLSVATMPMVEEAVASPGSTSMVARLWSRARAAAPEAPAPRAAPGGWARSGTSGVQSTAFSALGAQAQAEAADAARRRAEQRAGVWQSPRQLRRDPSARRRLPGDPPRAAFVAARDRFAQGAGGSLRAARKQGARLWTTAMRVWTAWAVVSAVARAAFAVKCGPGSPCPSDAPCCSVQGECGAGAVQCAAGCNPMYSHSPLSCVANPVCVNLDLDVAHTVYNHHDVFVPLESFTGDPDAGPFLFESGYLGQGGQGVLLETNKGHASRVSTTRYMLYGTINATLRHDTQKGLISTFGTLSDVGDAIAWKFAGANASAAAASYYALNNETNAAGTRLDLGRNFSMADYHTYGLQWEPSGITWTLDGRAVHHVSRREAGAQFPRSPSRVLFTTWGATPQTPRRLRKWAGGAMTYDSAAYATTGYFAQELTHLSVSCGNLSLANVSATGGGSQPTSFVYTGKNSSVSGEPEFMLSRDQIRLLSDPAADGPDDVPGSPSLAANGPNTNMYAGGTRNVDTTSGGGSSSSTGASSTNGASGSDGHTSTKVAIGVPVGIGGAVLAGSLGLVALYLVRRRRKARAAAAAPSMAEAPGVAPLGVWLPSRDAAPMPAPEAPAAHPAWVAHPYAPSPAAAPGQASLLAYAQDGGPSEATTLHMPSSDDVLEPKSPASTMYDDERDAYAYGGTDDDEDTTSETSDESAYAPSRRRMHYATHTPRSVSSRLADAQHAELAEQQAWDELRAAALGDEGAAYARATPEPRAHYARRAAAASVAGRSARRDASVPRAHARHRSLYTPDDE
ncbi:hypothetical protein MBRA1_003697 [Malassezia brasiliensis]|uniref:GH16 domain-containing protein n=1 Tax=Malassezia brasiliensis TaxID=1821822 RepID=A0AAF0E0T5_9BASI|nr:hypothetical protein MBRA1_003697 [Malassezia brasiliensis]